ncbi:MAG: hypothetical protein ABUK01_03780 [Leptospirales bacterium]
MGLAEYEKLDRVSRFKIILKITGMITLVGIVVVYNVFFSKAFVKSLIVNNFQELSNGKISLDVTKASLFRGFTFENIEILSGPDFNHTALLKVDKINLKYTFLGFFVGDIGIHEFGIYKPAVFLTSKNGVWNYETLMKPGEAEVEEEEIEELEEEESTSIDLPFSIRIFVKFILEDFSIAINNETDKSDAFVAGVNDFTLHTYFISKRFTKIPMTLPDIVDSANIIEKFYVNLDPQKTIDVYYKNSSTISKSPLNLHWLISSTGTEGSKDFFSRLILGSSDLPVTYKGKHSLPLDFFIDYELDYQPELDRLTLDFLKINFKKDTWMNFEGYIDNVTNSDTMKLNLNLDKSNIVLDKVHPFYTVFTGDNSMKFGGTISLAPLKIKGPLNNLKVDGNLTLNNVFVRTGDSNSKINHLKLSYETLINTDLEGIPVVFAKINWDGRFNNSPLGARIEYRPEQQVYVKAFIKRFNPYQYSGKSLNGKFDFDVTVKGPNERNLNSTVNLKSSYFRYYINNGRSGTNRMNFRMKSKMTSPDTTYNKVKLNISVLSVTLLNKENLKTAWINSNVNITKNFDQIDTTFNLTNFSVNVFDLYPSLTYSLQESLDAAAKKLHKNITFSGKTTVKMNGENIDLDHHLNGKIEDFNINDLDFTAIIKKKGSRIDIPVIQLKGFNKALNLQIDGHLKDNNVEWVPHLKIDFLFSKKNRDRIFQNQTIQGEVKLLATWVDNIIKGDFNIDDFSYDNGSFTRVNHIVMEFPFIHNTRLKTVLNTKAAKKENLIPDYQKNINYNFKIKSVDMEISSMPNQPTEIISPKADDNGFSASMYYKDNVFYLPSLQINILNGVVIVRDSYFNVGTGDPAQMEYLMKVQVKDIDLKNIMPPLRAKSIENGKLSMDINISGNRLDKPLENMIGYFSVYKMGPDFGKSAIKIIKPDLGVNWVNGINDRIKVNKMDARIEEGLIYADIYGDIPALKNSMSQERIPVTEFLQRTTNEVKSYRIKKVKYEKAVPEREGS